MLDIPWTPRVTMTDLINKINEIVDWCNAHDDEHAEKVRTELAAALRRSPPSQLVNLTQERTNGEQERVRGAQRD